MALLLSCRFSRCLATISRIYSFERQTYASRRRAYFEIRTLARNFSVHTNNIASQDSKLDRTLRRLDQEARRAGRVSKRELEEALENLTLSKSATSTQSLLLIRCCGSLLPEETSEIRTQLVEELWRMLHNLAVPVDISHYNALLQVYLENEHHFSPTEFLRDLENKGIEPNRVTYQRLVERYCQTGDIKGATHILEFMRSKKLPVNEHIFNSLILGHSQVGDMKSAADILSVMKHAGLEPSSETYRTLLCGFAKYGDIESIRSTLELCAKEEILLVDQDYMDIVYTLAINDHSQYVDEIIKKFQCTTGYNQNAVNLILKLTNKKKFTVAKKILLTMPPGAREGQLLPSGSFFIKQLVKANCPIQEILAVSEELKKEGLNDRGLLVATESSLSQGNVGNSYLLFSTLKEQGYPIRQHYFWPLIISCGKTGNSKGILDILRTMSEKFEIEVQGETLRNYAIPWLRKLSSTSSEDLISTLQSACIPVETAVISLVHHLLLENNIADALRIVNEFNVTYLTGQLRTPLIQAYQRTKDTKSFVGMLFAMYSATEKVGTTRVNTSFADETMPILDRYEMVGQIIIELVSSQRTMSSSEIKTLLEALCKRGINISNSTAERFVEKIGNELLTTEISDLLDNITSRAIASRQEYKPSSQRSFWSETRPDSYNVKKQLLSSYCRNRNLEKAHNLWNELLSNGTILTPGLAVQLLDLYLFYEDKEKALDLLKWSQNRFDYFTLNKLRVVKLASILVKNNDIEGAKKLLNDYSQTQKAEELTFALSSVCRLLLNYLADQGDVTNVNQIFDCLLKNNYIDINNSVLGPLVKVHLVRNDVDSAIRQFEELCRLYHCTPMKNELTHKLIEAEDAASLQRITDLSTKVHGEVNSLYDLVFAFVECGRIRQARKILETPGLHSRPQRVQVACKRYSQEGMISSLEGLVEAAKSLSHIDSSDIYQHLLQTYCKKNDAENALGLWVKMQEENLQPTDEFLFVLGTFLKDKGLPLPFVLPKEKFNIESDENANIGQSATENFVFHLENNKFEESLEIFMRMDGSLKSKVSLEYIISLLEGLSELGKHEDVHKLLLDILQLNLHPINKKFRNIIEHISAKGDILTLKQIGAHIDTDMKKMVLYNDNLCRAYTVAGKANEYLNILENEIDGANNDDVPHLTTKFPKNSILLLLKNNTDLHSHYQRICEKYKKFGIIVPYNMLWIFYAMNHQYENADDIWDKYLLTSQRLKYDTISRSARDNQDLPQAKYVVNKLKESGVEIPTYRFAYICVIDILLSMEKPEEAIEYLKESETVFSYNNLPREIQQKLEDMAKKKGLSLNFS